MKLHALLFSVVLALPLPAAAIDVAVGFSPRTGDVTVDAYLGDINVYGRSHSGAFIDDVVVSFGAPRLFVQELYTTRRWAPGDIYYACALAQQLGRPCRDIVELYDRDRGRGWGALAQSLGIKPGSAAFHALKGRVGKGHGAMRGGKGNSEAGRGGRPETAAPGRGGKPDEGSRGQGGDDRGGGKGKGKGKG